jgi:hypothetical protein
MTASSNGDGPHSLRETVFLCVPPLKLIRSIIAISLLQSCFGPYCIILFIRGVEKAERRIIIAKELNV